MAHRGFVGFLRPGVPARVVICAAALLMVSSGSAAGTNQLPNIFERPLSLTDALNVALVQSPGIQRARKALEAEKGVIVQTRAIAFPRMGITSDYTAVEPSSVDQPPEFVPGFTFGTDQSWQARISVVQSLYEGGRILSSLRTARLLQERSLLNYNVAVADAILQVQLAYYAVLAAQAQIGVQEASISLLTRELTDTTRRFEAGTVPRFNVLRAEVELANARPRLSRARNQMRIARNILANALGADVPQGVGEEIPLQLTDALVAEPLSLELPQAVKLAFAQRQELAALRTTRALRREDTASAKAGYKPRLEAFAGYEAKSSIFSPDLTDELHGWLTGVQLTWSIFDGGQTRGRVTQARAQEDLAELELEDAVRRTELEVRTAHSTFVEARELLASQEKVVEQAEEALRLANTRSDAGAGTQLDVLSAQTALTDARSTRVQALHDYSAARSRLERAIGSIPFLTRNSPPVP